MSDPRAKAERSKVKDIRQGVPQREVMRGKKKRIEKPIEVWTRYVWLIEETETGCGLDWLFHRYWRKGNSFATPEQAQDWIEKEHRSMGSGVRGMVNRKYLKEFEIRSTE